VTLLLALVLLSAAFLALHFVRLKRALHVFQLEGYKRGRFLRWCRQHLGAALFLSPAPNKKPLVMTDRAQRLLVGSMFISVVWLLPAVVKASGEAATPSVAAWAFQALLLSVGAPVVIAAADLFLIPAERSVNRRFMDAATAKLRELSPLVIGVTGSFGKTSTKFAIQQLLDGGTGIALATPGSFNTPLGISRTINERLDPRHRFFVVEMGAYGEGEIAELCRFVHPSIGVLTAIGPAHLERFGSMDAIRRAKYEIVTSLPEDGIAVMNVDDPEVRTLADSTQRHTVIRYGVDDAGRPDVTAMDIQTTPAGMVFSIVDSRDGSSLPVHTGLLGDHSVGHVLAAVAVALTTGSRLNELQQPIEALRPVEHRLQLLEGAGGITVIDDAYNSNPQGAAAALEVLCAMPARRRVVVTPGMIELGELQFAENKRFGERASAVADVLVVVARTNREAITSGARNGGAEVVTVDSLAQATEWLQTILGQGDVVLFENDLPDHYES
jgi:UDP-N-acetylmuramoyl-tripeptide--D-alanyl-D-alanine ligase